MHPAQQGIEREAKVTGNLILGIWIWRNTISANRDECDKRLFILFIRRSRNMKSVLVALLLVTIVLFAAVESHNRGGPKRGSGKRKGGSGRSWFIRTCKAGERS